MKNLVDVRKASDYGYAVEEMVSIAEKIGMEDERIESVYSNDTRAFGGYPIYIWLKVKRKSNGLLDRIFADRDVITAELMSHWVDFTQEPFRDMYRLTHEEPVNCIDPDYLELAKKIAEGLNKSVYLPNQ